MLTTRLGNIGDSVMLIMPKALLKRLNLNAGPAVDIADDGDRFAIKPAKRPHYSLSDLLAACDFVASSKGEDRDWLDDCSSGRELI